MDRESAKRIVESTLRHLQRAGVPYVPAVDPGAARQRAEEAFPGWFESAVESPAHAGPESSPAPDATRAAGGPRPRSELPKPKPLNRTRPDRFAPAPAVDDGPTSYSLPVLGREEREIELQRGAALVSQCTRCPELVHTRKQTVYGEGNPEARVCFFGEGPGADEDRQGRPFVGRSGQLLTRMIEACTFRREDIYILNTVKCRPPGNRNPEHEEVEQCREYFERQFEVIQPEYIVCLGLVAAKALLRTTLPVGRLRGTFHRYRTSKVVVTYHPSYLLRTPAAKRAAWDDLQMMLRDMGIDPRQS